MLASQHISTTDNGIIHAINREERLDSMVMKKIAFFDTKPYDKESLMYHRIRSFVRMTAAKARRTSPAWK